MEKSEIQWKYKRGKSFEDLVFYLLKCMFPNITFRQTDYVHDGGKDFYSVGKLAEETIWVEAKNYQNHLELSKFSNTFIMADISEINRIIIFSMSEITKGARINMGRYAAYHKKVISVYSGQDVLLLINQYRNAIPLKEYIENLDIIDSLLNGYVEPYDKISVTYEHYRTKQFNLAYRRNTENYIKINDIPSLPLNTFIAQEILITNRDLLNSQQVAMDYTEYNRLHISACFYERPDSILVPPAATYVLVIFFKITDYIGNLKLPIVNFKNIEIEKDENSYEVNCYWMAEIPYIGKAWEDLQNTITIIENDIHKNIIVIEGKSGVGKTRFLDELAGYFFRSGSRIISLDFRSITNTSLKNILQCILNNIYVLDETYNDKEIFISKFGELYKDFYDIIFDETYDCQKNSDRIINLLISLFIRKKIVLVIDNVQDVSNEGLGFFEKLFSYINNISNKYIHIVLCFNQDYVFQDSIAQRALLYVEQLTSTQTVKLNDFDREDARLYLRENLDATGLRLDLYTYYENIITRFGTNPFVLKNIILYLKQRKVISFVNATAYISDLGAMKQVLSELPDGILKIIQYRYKHFCNKINRENDVETNRIIWTILFLGCLKSNWVSWLKLSPNIVQELVDYAFIEYNEKAEMVFCHQLIEKSFCLLFSAQAYVKRPCLNFINDADFLEQMAKVIDRIGRINLPVENMLLRSHLHIMTADHLHLALKYLITNSPRAIMLPLIINTITDCLNEGIKTDASIEIQALYSISMTCQEKIDVNCAAEYTRDLVYFEQETYRDKLSAKNDLIIFFKNYTFQLPPEEKYVFLDWFMKETPNFELPKNKYHLLLGWIYNRYSKNLCSEHKFSSALNYAEKALNIALQEGDFLSAAQAEIEYGNIYAYTDASKTILHWKNCVKLISKYKNVSTYFEIYKLGYGIYCNLLTHKLSNTVAKKIEKLLGMRKETFLYQQLFIDDIYADYYIIKFLDNECSFETFKGIIPKLVQMKSDSYMHTSNFTILATYKLFTVGRLIYEREPAFMNQDTLLSYVYELIDNNIFVASKLAYSKFILFEIYSLYKKDEGTYMAIKNKLPDIAQRKFECMNQAQYINEFKHAITPLSNKGRTVNLLPFNYTF